MKMRLPQQLMVSALPTAAMARLPPTLVASHPSLRCWAPQRFPSFHYNVSVAVAVGFIALAGVAAETGVVMLIYLDHALEARAAQRRTEGRALDARDLREAQDHDRRWDHCGLLPIMWSTGAGSEVMRRIAAPMVGGMVSSTILTLLVIPALFALAKRHALARKSPAATPQGLPHLANRDPAHDTTVHTCKPHLRQDSGKSLESVQHERLFHMAGSHRGVP